MKNRKILFIVSAALAAAILFSGCMTVSPAGDDQMLEIIELINASDSENLAARSADTFLLDAEVLHNPKLIKNLWQGLAESEFKISNPVIEGNPLMLPADESIFGSGPEVDAFFNKYVPENTSIFMVAADTGNYAFILGPSDAGKSMILAFGGPF